MEKGRISPTQFGILVFMFVVSSSTLLIPSLTALYAEQDAWIVTIVGMLLAIPLVWLYIALGTQHPTLNLIEYSEKILGRWLGKCVSVLFVFYFLIITSGLLWQTGDMLATLVLTETPMQWIEIMFLFIITTAIRLGLEVYSRAAVIFFPWVLLFLLLLLLSLLPLIEFTNIQPIFEGHFPGVIKGTIVHIGIPFLDLVILLMLFPYVSNVKRAKYAYYAGMLAGSSLVIAITFLSILILGPELTEQSTYPVYTLAQRVNIANFIQRIEVLVGGIWFISLFFKITVCFYACVVGTAQICGLQHYKLLTLPFGLIVLPLSLLMFSSTAAFREFLLDTWTISVTPYGIVLPLLLLGVNQLRKRRKSKSA